MKKLTRKAVKKWLEEHEESARDLFIGCEDRDAESMQLFDEMLITLLLPEDTTARAMEILDALAAVEEGEMKEDELPPE